MAMILRPLVVDGVTIGSIHTLEKVGDQLPEHVHLTEDWSHITILTHGTIRLLGKGEKHEGMLLSPKPGSWGTIVNWKANVRHGMEAVTDGATFINIYKNPTIGASAIGT